MFKRVLAYVCFGWWIRRVWIWLAGPALTALLARMLTIITGGPG